MREGVGVYQNEEGEEGGGDETFVLSSGGKEWSDLLTSQVYPATDRRREEEGEPVVDAEEDVQPEVGEAQPAEEKEKEVVIPLTPEVEGILVRSFLNPNNSYYSPVPSVCHAIRQIRFS